MKCEIGTWSKQNVVAFTAGCVLTIILSADGPCEREEMYLN